MSRRGKRGEAVTDTAPLDALGALIDSGAGELFQAVHDGTVLSSVLVLMAKRGAYYHSAGNHPKGMALGASHFLIQEIASYLRERSFEVFNLGGSDQTNPGLSRFKAGFGASVVDLEEADFFLSEPRSVNSHKILSPFKRHIQVSQRMTGDRPSPVLILGAEPRIAVSIARSLGRRGIPVDVTALSRTDLRMSSRAIREFSYLPDHQNKGPDFIAALTRLIRSNHYSLLIPCSDTALTEVVKYYDRLESIVKVGSPRPEIIKRVLDKDHTLKLAQRLRHSGSGHLSHCRHFGIERAASNAALSDDCQTAQQEKGQQFQNTIFSQLR